MKRYRAALAILILCVCGTLSAGAYQMLSSFDTATPHRFQLQVFGCSSLNLAGKVREVDFYYNGDSYSGISGLGLDFGIDPCNEAGLDAWIGHGAKLHYKRLLKQKANSVLSIAPAYNFEYGTYETTPGSNQNTPQGSQKYYAHGLELAVLYTIPMSEKNSCNLSARMNLDLLNSTGRYEVPGGGVEDMEWGPYFIAHGGVTANWRFHLGGHIAFIPELGLEVCSMRNDAPIVRFSGGMAVSASWDFPK